LIAEDLMLNEINGAGELQLDRRQRALHDYLAAGVSIDKQVGAALVKSPFDQVRLGQRKVSQHIEDEALLGVRIFAIAEMARRGR
jgi:hypothetical protein